MEILHPDYTELYLETASSSHDQETSYSHSQ